MITSCGSTSMVTVLRSTLIILSTIGKSRKRPGPFALPCTRPSLKMTPRSYSLTMRTALARMNTTNNTTANATTNKQKPATCNNPKPTSKLLF